MIGRVILGIIALFLLIGVFAASITNGIHGWRTNDTTQQFVVTLAVGAETANVTLGHDLYQAATDEVYSVTSNITETPVASAYVEATKVLGVSGLDDANSRVLTVSYYAETDDDTMRILGPFLGLLIFGGLSFAIVLGVIKKGR